MKKITFFLFLLTILLVFILIPEELLNENLLSLETLSSPKTQLLNMLKQKTPKEAYTVCMGKIMDSGELQTAFLNYGLKKV